ncbi:MAG: hypothetical protein ABW076_09435 [Candidatus Thiodiazotropha sp.]
MHSFQPFEPTQGPPNIVLCGALTASLGLHLLLAWWLANSLDLNPPGLHGQTSSGALRVKLQRRGPVAPEPAASPDTPYPASAEPSSYTPGERLPEHAHPPPGNNRATGKTKSQHTPSTQALLRSAGQVAREIARTIPDSAVRENHSDSTSVAARLDRALNPKREAAGVSVRADGTTRVVTDWGYSYCIKPLEEGQIVDPGEDIRVSMVCR